MSPLTQAERTARFKARQRGEQVPKMGNRYHSPVWPHDVVKHTFDAAIAEWGGYAPPSQTLDRGLVGALARQCGSYTNACRVFGAKKRPKGMKTPPTPEAPPEAPAPLDYDACLCEMERDLYHRRRDKKEAERMAELPERHIPVRHFRDFHVEGRYETRQPSFLPARDAIDTWRITRRDAA